MPALDRRNYIFGINNHIVRKLEINQIIKWALESYVCSFFSLFQDTALWWVVVKMQVKLRV